MSFSIARGPMLALLADAMDIRPEGRSAFLGRFQHLQRLKLVEGINPGRGTAAEYKANHLMVIAITMQLLQLGLTPERAVRVIKNNQDRVRLAISLAVPAGRIEPSFLWFDAALLTQTTGLGHDVADATFDYGGIGVFKDRMEWFSEVSYLQRLSLVSISGTIWHLIQAMDPQESFRDQRPTVGPNGQVFINALGDWYSNSKPDSLA